MASGDGGASSDEGGNRRRGWRSIPYQPVPRAPFALSRFSSHDPELFDAAEEAVVAYLEERVMEQLSDQGVPEDAVGLDDVKYVRMMAKFREERRAQVEDLGEERSVGTSWNAPRFSATSRRRVGPSWRGIRPRRRRRREDSR